MHLIVDFVNLKEMLVYNLLVWTAMKYRLRERGTPRVRTLCA